MKALRWIARHWYIPAIALVAAVGFLLGSRRGGRQAVRDELAAIDAGEATRLQEIEIGTEAANAAADAVYEKEINALNKRKAAKAECLRSDPAARVRFLHRLLSDS